MHVHIVKKVTFSPQNAAVDSFHHTMFHGIGKRGEPGMPCENYSMGDNLEQPLEMHINFHRLNAIVMPSLNLVVSEGIRHLFDGVAGVTLFQTKIVQAVSIPYAEFDFSHWNDPAYRDDGEEPERILLNGHSDLAALPSGFAYHEVICHELFALTQRSKAEFHLDYDFPELGEDGQIPVTLGILAKYPLLSYGGDLVIAEALFKKLREHFNPHYFVNQRVKVSP